VTTSAFTTSGFGDEIDADPAEQLATLVQPCTSHLYLRRAWNRNVLDVTGDDRAALRAASASHRATVAMIAPPVSTSPISEPAAFEAERLPVALRLAGGPR
jgi:hypothetical protein